MVIFRHELRQGRRSLLIWSAAISMMLGLCIFIYPEMAEDMEVVGAIFSRMGSFSAAFGMDKINFGVFTGFFAVECGNILGLGGAFYAALIGISALSKEEKDRTAEFLLTHPVLRRKVIAEKLLAVVAQILILNVVAVITTIFSIWAIGENGETDTLALLFLAYFLMQLEVAAVTFCLSAFLRRGSLGIGLGLAAVFYFLNIAANLTDRIQFLKFFTPFGYTDGAEIIVDHAINSGYLSCGVVFGIIGIALAFWQYTRKDIV